MPWGARPGRVTDGVAVQLLCSGDAAVARTTLETLLPHADVIVRPAGAPFPRLLVADMDSTMISVECIDELADYAGIKPQIAAITERAMQGELDFAAALRERVACLAGLDERVIEQCLAERVRPMPGALALILTLGERGTRCVLVSGGFTRFTDPVAAMIGFHRAVANVLEIEDGRLTGRVIDPIVDSAAKRVTLEAEAAAIGAGMDECIAIGDGANDIPMINAAGFGIAYHGHAKAVAAADAAIRAGDHTSLLYALGIPCNEWIR
jgi:phosphoserine phosphatase